MLPAPGFPCRAAAPAAQQRAGSWQPSGQADGQMGRERRRNLSRLCRGTPERRAEPGCFMSSAPHFRWRWPGRLSPGCQRSLRSGAAGTAPVPSAALAHAPCAAGVTLGGPLVRAGGRLRAGGASGGVPGPVPGYPLQPGALSARGERLQEEALGQQLPALSWVCLSAGCGAGSPSWLQ